MAEKTEIKEHIAAMKVKRDDAIARQAHDELKQIRRGIRTLKRRIRALANAAKAHPIEAQAPQAGYKARCVHSASSRSFPANQRTFAPLPATGGRSVWEDR